MKTPSAAIGMILANTTQGRNAAGAMIVAEGAEDHLMELLQAIRRSNLGKYISNELMRRSAAIGEFTGFGVRH